MFDDIIYRFEDKRPFFLYTFALTLAFGVGLMMTQFPIVGLLGNTAVFALLSTSPLLGIGVVIGLIVLIFRYPIAGLGLALMAGPWGAIESLFLGETPLDSGQIFLLLTVVAWLVRGLYQRQIIIPRESFFLPLFLFMAVAMVSILDAPSFQYGLQELIKWVEIWLIVVIILSEATLFKSSKQAVQLIVGLMLAAGFVQALIGIWQFGLRGTGPAHFLITGNFYRAYGSFEQPNPFGGLMHLTALLALGTLTAYLPHIVRYLKYLRLGARKEKKHVDSLLSWWILFLLICGVTAVLSLLFSWSRGAWLGFAAGAAAVGLFWPPKRWIGLVGLTALCVLVLLVFQLDVVPVSISQRLLGFVSDFQLGDVRGVDINDSNYSVLERLAHWQAAIDMARDQLWMGVGFGNYEPAYASYALINWPDPLGHAHNYYLNILAETGIIGLSAYLLFWFAVILKTIRGIHTKVGFNRGLLLGLLGCWVAISVHHLVDKLFVNNLYIQLGALLGLLLLIVRENDELDRDLPK